MPLLLRTYRNMEQYLEKPGLISSLPGCTNGLLCTDRVV